MVTKRSRFPAGPVVLGTEAHPHPRPNPGTSTSGAKFVWKASDIQITPRVPIIGRAAIYARVSTDRQQDGASLDVQREACIRYCESHGLVVAAELVDVQSGWDEDRPKYMKAIELAKSKAVDKLVVWRFDRLGRDEVEYLTQLKNLRRIGVEVASATQPNDSILVQNLLGVLAGEESRQIAIRVAASKRHRVKEGKWGGGVAPLGYDTVKHPDSGRVLSPNDDAAVVQELFKMYASGKYNLNNLRRFLSEKRGKTLTRGAIWGILRNPVYTGVIRHGVWSKSKVMPRPKEVTESKGLHPAIVDEATFNKVQARLSANKSRANGGTNPAYLFSGLIYCGECGRKFAGHRAPRGEPYYFCSRKVGAGDCQSHAIAETKIRAAVIEPLEKLLRKLQRSNLRAKVRGELVRQQAAIEAAADAERVALEAKRTRLSERLTRVEDLYFDGGMTRERYLERRDALQLEIADIKAKLSARPAQAHSDMNDLFAIADALDGESPDGQEWREIVAGTVERIEINDREVGVVWREGYGPLLVRMA